MTRQEHLEWAKERALALCSEGKNVMAWIGFKHDLYKHEAFQTDKSIAFLFSTGDTLVHFALQSFMPHAAEQVDPSLGTGPFNIRAFIEGFQA